jgi:hypothetical protein
VNILDEKLIAALIGTLSAILTSMIAIWASHRKLRAELLSKYRSELINKQIEACEKLWEKLESTSFSYGK